MGNPHTEKERAPIRAEISADLVKRMKLLAVLKSKYVYELYEEAVRQYLAREEQNQENVAGIK